MFRGVRLILLFDLWIVVSGLALLLDHWRPLTGKTVDASVIHADPVCRYSVYSGESRRRSSVPRLQPISGKCVETEEAAKRLIKTGYNQVSKGWIARATIDGEKSPVEFYVYDAGYLATKQSWALFLWGDRKLEIGCRMSLLRSSTGYGFTPLKQPQTIGDKLYALYRVIIGIVFSFGTVAIYVLHYLQGQRPKRD